MPTILLKKSDTPGSVPGTANLTNLAGGVEVAVNTADKRMFSMTSASAVVELGTNPSSLTCADGSFVLLKAASASITNLTATSLVLSNLSIASANITTLTSSSATISTTLALSGGTANGVLYLNGSKVATSGSALVFDGTNLGVGATLSAWRSTDKAVQIGGQGAIAITSTNRFQFGTNFYTDTGGTNTYIGTGNATRYDQINGEHQWRYAASGTAGNPITFTQAMTLDSSGNLGIGETNPSAYSSKLVVVNTSAGASTNGAYFVNGSTTANTEVAINLMPSNATTRLGVISAIQDGAQNISLKFSTSAAASPVERMRLDSSGNVGIGTSSPAVPLDVVSNSGSNGINIRVRSSNDYGFLNFKSYDGSDTAGSIAALRSGVNAGSLLFYTGTTEKMRLDSSGNLGIGTSSPAYKLDVAGTAKLGPVNPFEFVTNAMASTASGQNGAVVRSAVSTESNPSFSNIDDTNTGMFLPGSDVIGFTTGGTERARIDSSGNLGIGTSSPGTKLDVNGDIRASNEIYLDNGKYLRFKRNSGGLSIQTLGIESGTDNVRLVTTGTLNVVNGSLSTMMLLDASGNLGVGTSSPTSASGYTFITLQDSGANNGAVYESKSGAVSSRYYSSGANSFGAIGTFSNYPFIFVTNSAERARITSGGYFKASDAGTYNNSTGAYHELRQTANDTCAYISATNASMAYNVIAAVATRGASSAFNFLSCAANSVDQFYVRGDGVVYAQNTTIQSISDARLKENVRDASEGLNVINALRSVRYDWKEGFGNNRKDQLGFIAQEVEAVFPDAVSEWKAKEGEEAYKTVGPAALIPVLVKAIQELSAKVAALEAK